MRRARSSIRTAAVVLCAVGGCTAAAPSPAVAAKPAPLVEVTLATKSGKLVGPLQVRAKQLRLKAGSRRCTVVGGTALAALVALQKKTGKQIGKLGVTAQGRCTSRARPTDGLYLRSIGRERASGPDGWIYDVNGRRGSTGSADRSGPRGDGRLLKNGQRVNWRWCGASTDQFGGCGAELRVSAPSKANSGVPLRVAVTERAGGIGDEKSVPARAGIDVIATTLNGTELVRAQTGAGGIAMLELPAGTAGRVQLTTVAPDGIAPAGRLVVVRP